MIINPIKIFGNFYDDTHISNYRLLLHGEACYAALHTVLADVAAGIEAPLNNYRELLGGIVSARAVLKGQTATTDDYTEAFLDTMRQAEDTLGAKRIRKGDPIYLEFFPQGLDGYNDINRGNAASLMQLAADAATRHAALLGTDLADELRSFPGGWLTVRSGQQGQSGKVDEKAAAIRAARRSLELALCQAIHEVGARFPGDADKCASFFAFDLLYRAGRKKAEAPGMV
ncbi:hypothetical protein EPD60_13380 [Flaviaesturariibacter flavus]|uniref:Uncharacterized protein n=1 Tax=Flaviaesturariibacter flavus TaxID=2502780 RepID=A0A4R1B8W3_9BACT|nr:hypothetical protein [Flaviaesturariibacter flavus]TCJ13375.1 hypothetical protein EPD60_13380 [Flaviaesturariibacter flavus]